MTRHLGGSILSLLAASRNLQKQNAKVEFYNTISLGAENKDLTRKELHLTFLEMAFLLSLHHRR